MKHNYILGANSISRVDLSSAKSPFRKTPQILCLLKDDNNKNTSK